MLSGALPFIFFIITAAELDDVRSLDRELAHVLRYILLPKSGTGNNRFHSDISILKILKIRPNMGIGGDVSLSLSLGAATGAETRHHPATKLPTTISTPKVALSLVVRLVYHHCSLFILPAPSTISGSGETYLG